LQLGSFNKLANAEALLKKMLDEVDDRYDGKLGIINQQGNYKVRLGPFTSDAAVRSAAESLKVKCGDEQLTRQTIRMPWQWTKKARANALAFSCLLHQTAGNKKPGAHCAGVKP
jgi:hypothetical protein